MEAFIGYVLLAFLAVTAVGLIRIRNLFAVAMLAGIYSLLSAGLFVVMDAVDVAFTEAAVGSGMSTVLVIATLALVGSEAKPPAGRRSILPIVLVLLTGGVLVYGSVYRRRVVTP